MTLDELDSLSAERIMGYKFNSSIGYDNEHWTFPDSSGLSVSYRIDCIEWQPTRNIAQAWELLEKIFNIQMKGHAGPTKLHSLRNWPLGRWEIIFYSDFGYGDVIAANTAPEAVTRACLKAIGEKVET